jgi:SAM-dependent methyltransferase
MDAGSERAGVPGRRLLHQQLTYYEARAAEYDDWWERRGRYDRGEEMNERWRAEIAEVRAAFDQLPLSGDVLELAPGTGYWTELLAKKASRVTALDGSAAMIALNRARLGGLADKVDYQQVDLFDWSPSRRWDGLVFCFWISHVPRDRLAGFFATCRESLHDGAVMFFLDGRRVAASTAVDHVLPDNGDEVMVRRLNDGREFPVVKNFYEPAELVRAAAAARLSIEAVQTDTFFQYGLGTART